MRPPCDRASWGRPWRRRRGRPPFFLFWGWLMIWALFGIAWTYHASGHAPYVEPAILVVLLVGGGLAASVTGRFSRRLDRLSRAVEAINLRDLSVRVPVEGGDSVAALARAFNRMLDRLEAEERVRRALFADVAHEIRHPLAGIRTRLDAIQDGVLPLDHEQLLRVSDAASDLARLVGDLQDLSLADVGQLRLERRPVDVAALVEQIRELMAPVAEHLGVTLTTTVAVGIGTLFADPARLRQVLLNLLSNGLHHTPRGGSVSLEVVPEDRAVVFRVGDTGEGIDPADLPHIFERFYRADRARSRTGGGGSGLGLAIVRSLVELHGGTVSVRSNPGAGSVFVVRVPEA